MELTLKIWRQANAKAQGAFKTYQLNDFEEAMSVPEMLDHLNRHLIKTDEDPIAFESDCREGICGQCGFVISGNVHSPEKQTTTCQTHLRSFKDGQTLVLEPFRVGAFPVKKDLMIDRSPLDRIIQAGGFISVNTGPAPEANSQLIAHEVAESAFDAAACIGCGACAAVCPNASISLFTAAKVNHLAQLPQGQLEAKKRVLTMVQTMDAEGFGSCSLVGACAEVCPQGISLSNIANMNNQYLKAILD
jgi:succinate dehydrogenase / fumarate reductase iron-sulfur subunit